jgi:hypothetical protein
MHQHITVMTALQQAGFYASLHHTPTGCCTFH